MPPVLVAFVAGTNSLFEIGFRQAIFGRCREVLQSAVIIRHCLVPLENIWGLHLPAAPMAFAVLPLIQQIKPFALAALKVLNRDRRHPALHFFTFSDTNRPSGPRPISILGASAMLSAHAIFWTSALGGRGLGGRSRACACFTPASGGRMLMASPAPTTPTLPQSSKQRRAPSGRTRRPWDFRRMGNRPTCAARSPLPRPYRFGPRHHHSCAMSRALWLGRSSLHRLQSLVPKLVELFAGYVADGVPLPALLLSLEADRVWENLVEGPPEPVHSPPFAGLGLAACFALIAPSFSACSTFSSPICCSCMAWSWAMARSSCISSRFIIRSICFRRMSSSPRKDASCISCCVFWASAA